MGKTTVEILDRGEETPRSPPISGHPSGDLSSSAPRKLSQVNAAMGFARNKLAVALTSGQDESQFRPPAKHEIMPRLGNKGKPVRMETTGQTGRHSYVLFMTIIYANVSELHLRQAAALAPTGEDEGRFRSLTFKEEEGRVRDGFDTYIPGSGSLGEGLQKLKAERDR